MWIREFIHILIFFYQSRIFRGDCRYCRCLLKRKRWLSDSRNPLLSFSFTIKLSLFWIGNLTRSHVLYRRYYNLGFNLLHIAFGSEIYAKIFRQAVYLRELFNQANSTNILGVLSSDRSSTRSQPFQCQTHASFLALKAEPRNAYLSIT